MDGTRRHVEAQQAVRQRRIIAERQAPIQRAAELEHDNDDNAAGNQYAIDGSQAPVGSL